MYSKLCHAFLMREVITLAFDQFEFLIPTPEEKEGEKRSGRTVFKGRCVYHCHNQYFSSTVGLISKSASAPSS